MKWSIGAGFTFHRGDQADLERMLDLLIHNPELRRQSAARERQRISGPVPLARNRSLYRKGLLQRIGLEPD